MDKQSYLKPSYYNFIIPNGEDTCILYNSLTGAILSTTEKEELAQVTAIFQKETLLYEDTPILSLLYEKGFLVNQDLNEYEYVRYLYEKEIVQNNELSLTLITTRQCNLRCIYCYEKHENLTMSQDIYSRLLNHIEQALKEHIYSGVHITLFGGEPFLEYENIILFLKKIQKICSTYNIPYSVGATTNGTLLTPKHFEELSKLHVSYYQITIDGFASTHDKYRKSLGKEGSFQTIIQNLTYMNSTDYDFIVTIRTNFNDEVFSQAKKFYQFIKDNFDSRFHVYYEGIKKLGGDNDAILEILDSSDISTSSVEIAQFIYNLGITNDLVDSMTLPFSRVCYATKHNDYIIDYDGTILKCSLSLDDKKNKIGFVEEDGTFSIDDSKHAMWVGKKCEINEYCKSCKVFPVCYGGRCVNGLIHGENFSCNRELQEKELEQLIIYNME